MSQITIKNNKKPIGNNNKNKQKGRTNCKTKEMKLQQTTVKKTTIKTNKPKLAVLATYHQSG